MLEIRTKRGVTTVRWRTIAFVLGILLIAVIVGGGWFLVIKRTNDLRTVQRKGCQLLSEQIERGVGAGPREKKTPTPSEVILAQARANTAKVFGPRAVQLYDRRLAAAFKDHPPLHPLKCNKIK